MVNQRKLSDLEQQARDLNTDLSAAIGRNHFVYGLEVAKELVEVLIQRYFLERMLEEESLVQQLRDDDQFGLGSS